MSLLPPSRRKPRHSLIQQFFRDLGPGLFTGAAYDDPSGISPYFIADATLGYAGLWTALFSFSVNGSGSANVRDTRRSLEEVLSASLNCSALAYDPVAGSIRTSLHIFVTTV
jgi:hypothetical protein